MIVKNVYSTSLNIKGVRLSRFEEEEYEEGDAEIQNLIDIDFLKLI